MYNLYKYISIDAFPSLFIIDFMVSSRGFMSFELSLIVYTANFTSYLGHWQIFNISLMFACRPACLVLAFQDAIEVGCIETSSMYAITRTSS